jgi:hypothetical protein
MFTLWIVTVIAVCILVPVAWALVWLHRWDPLDCLKEPADPGQYGADPSPNLTGQMLTAGTVMPVCRPARRKKRASVVVTGHADDPAHAAGQTREGDPAVRVRLAHQCKP